jgi:hypothetical protein
MRWTDVHRGSRSLLPGARDLRLEKTRLTARGIALALAMVVLMVGMTQAMTIRAQAADVGGSSPPVAPTYLLFLWMAAASVLPTGLQRRLRLSRSDLCLAYCAAMISGAITHQYAIGFLVPHTVAPYYYGHWNHLHRWLPQWLGPRDPEVVRAFFMGTGGSVPWRAWLLPGFAWSVLLGALFLVGHCALILVRRSWVDQERLSFPLAQIPLGLTRTDASGRALLLREPLFWAGMVLPLLLGALRGLHRYLPAVPEVPLRPALEFDFAEAATPPWTGLGHVEFRLALWLIAIVALLPAEISFSGWVFFLVTKAEDVSAIYFGATDLPSVYSNDYPALYAQGAGAAYALAALTLWGSRRHLARMLRLARVGSARGEEDEFATPRFAAIGLVVGLCLLIGWFWLAGMRFLVAALLVGLMLGYFLIFARIRGEAGLGMGVILWPKMLDEVMLTLVGSRALLPGDLTVLYAVRWLYFGPTTGGVLACQLESFKIAGETGLRGRSVGGIFLLAALLAIPLAFAWTLHTYHVRGFLFMPIGQRGLSMVGSQVYWSYANLAEAVANPAGTDGAGVFAMGAGAAVAAGLTVLRARFVGWPLHPIGYMAANSWGMHWNWGSFLVGWLVKTVLLRYGGLRLFRRVVPFFLGMVVGDMLSEGIWGAVAAWVALGVRG